LGHYILLNLRVIASDIEHEFRGMAQDWTAS